MEHILTPITSQSPLANAQVYASNFTCNKEVIVTTGLTTVGYTGSIGLGIDKIRGEIDLMPHQDEYLAEMLNKLWLENELLTSNAHYGVQMDKFGGKVFTVYTLKTPLPWNSKSRRPIITLMHYVFEDGGRLKFHFSPWKADILGAINCIHDLFRILLPPYMGDGWEWVLKNAIIRQVDTCFDAPFNKAYYDIDRPFAKKAHTFVGKTKTDYIGSRSSSVDAIGYDKIADMKVKLLADHLSGDLMRIEVKKRNLKITFKDLETFSNPFRMLEVYERTIAEQILEAHGLILPANKCLAEFLRTEAINTKKRQRLRIALAPARAYWWNQYQAWENWLNLLKDFDFMIKDETYA